MKNTLNDFSLSTIVAGLIAVLVGYTSSAVIVFQAATAAGASASQAGAWLGIICVAMGILTVALSFKYKIPIMFAWSTPGAALLITSVGGFTLAECIGVFIFSSVMPDSRIQMVPKTFGLYQIKPTISVENEATASA